MSQNFTNFAYTDSVKAAQEKYGSRGPNARVEQSPDRFLLTEREIPFLESRNSFYMATVGENGWPYVQHRGGPEGFLKVVDDRTLAFPDYPGNTQYISIGNLQADQRACLIFVDYPRQERLKIWAHVKVVEKDTDTALMAKLAHAGTRAPVERAMVLTVQAYDWNCPQHITPRYSVNEVEDLLKAINPEAVESCVKNLG